MKRLNWPIASGPNAKPTAPDQLILGGWEGDSWVASSIGEHRRTGRIQIFERRRRRRRQRRQNDLTLGFVDARHVPDINIMEKAKLVSVVSHSSKSLLSVRLHLL